MIFCHLTDYPFILLTFPGVFRVYSGCITRLRELRIWNVLIIVHITTNETHKDNATDRFTNTSSDNLRDTEKLTQVPPGDLVT